jgi:hypothetical protein
MQRRRIDAWEVCGARGSLSYINQPTSICAAYCRWLASREQQLRAAAGGVPCAIDAGGCQHRRGGAANRGPGCADERTTGSSRANSRRRSVTAHCCYYDGERRQPRRQHQGQERRGDAHLHSDEAAQSTGPS